MSTSCFLATSSFEALSPEAQWTILAILLSALIAAVAANHAAERSARLTMENARELQDRERQLEEKSLAALLSADLHRKLILLIILLPEPRYSDVEELQKMGTSMGTSIRVLEAALPKLGSLGVQGAAQLLNAFDGVGLLIRDMNVPPGHGLGHFVPRIQKVAFYIGQVLNTLWRLYKLDRPDPLEKGLSNLDLEAIGLKELKDLGL